MNPLWIAVAAVVGITALPLTTIGYLHRRDARRERALSRRKKPKIQL
jgi:hypothetical protein